MATDVLAILQQIPGANKALGFLQTQAAAFAYVPTRINRLAAVLGQIQTVANARGDVVTAGQAAVMANSLGDVRDLYARTSGDMGAVITALNQGSGNVVALAGQLLKVGADVTLTFTTVDEYEKETTALQRGTLSAADLARIQAGPVGSLFTPTVKKVLLGVGAFLVYRWLTRRRRR